MMEGTEIELNPEYLRTLFLPRRNDSHKGDYGRLLIVAGCQTMPGAAVLARGYNAVDAACLGAWIHGYAGDVLTEECTAEAYSSRDLIERLWTGFACLYKPE